jgi:hypothetical protein
MSKMATDNLYLQDPLRMDAVTGGPSERTGSVEDYAKAWEKQLIAQNKSNLSKAAESEEKSEKEIADASKQFLQAKAKRIAGSVNASPTTRAAANEMQALQAFMGGGGSGIPGVSADAPADAAASSNTSGAVGDPASALQGSFENIQFTSDSASPDPLRSDALRQRNAF